MAKHEIVAAKIIQAAPEDIYAIIADYHTRHPRILPKPYFASLEVEQGGIGAGTVINYQMKLMGRLQAFRAEVTEPEPGRVLVETEVSTGATTTFTVEKHTGEQSALVSIGTVTDIRDGILGVIEGWFTTRLLRPIYEKELEQLETVVSTSSE